MKRTYLSDSRIYLRAVEPEDLDIMYAIENDPDLWDVSGISVPYSRFVLRQYIENSQSDMFADKQLRLMIVRQSDNCIIGTIDLTDFSPMHNRAAVGIGIMKDCRHEGYASVALELLVDYAFHFLHIHQLYAHVALSNTYSLKLFRKCGFVQTATLKNWVRMGETYEDAVFFQRINQV